MHILRIEHRVPDFDGWKKAFDSDPLGRKKSGVRRYRVLRPVDDRKYAMVDLEFDSLGEAEAMLATLRNLWSEVAGRVMESPQARIIELVESKEP
jgi:hypothetical protein